MRASVALIKRLQAELAQARERMPARPARDERKAFESHCKETLPEGMSLARTQVSGWGDYVDNDVEWMWNGWLARAALEAK